MILKHAVLTVYYVAILIGINALTAPWWAGAGLLAAMVAVSVAVETLWRRLQFRRMMRRSEVIGQNWVRIVDQALRSARGQ